LANVGYATLTVSPSMRGMQQSMQRQMSGIMPAAGQRAGRQLGQAIGAGATANVASDLRKASSAAAAEVARASGALAKARQAEITSANRVRQAEQRLTDTWNNSKATAAQLRRGREALATAQAQHGVATTQITQAQRQLTAAEAGASQAQRQLATATATTTQSIQAQGAQVARSAANWQTLNAGASQATANLRSGATSVGGAIASGITARTQQATTAMTNFGASVRGMAGMAAIFAGGMGLATMASDIMTVAAGAQNTHAVLDGLYQAAGHGAGEATKMTKLLNQEFGRSGIAMPAWQQGAQDLAYLGLNARETTSLMKFLDDAITATGGGADEVGRVTSALATMQNMGKTSLNEINMLSQSGIPIFDMMTAHLGMTNEEFSKAVSNGEILVDDVLAAIEAKGGTWANGLIEGAEGVNRTWSSAWDAMRSTIVNGIAQQLVPLLDRAAPKILALGEMVGTAFDALPAALSRLKGAMDRYGITDALTTMYDAARELARGAGPMLEGFGIGLAGALGLALLVLEPVAEMLRALGVWMQENEQVVHNFGIALGAVAGALLLIKGAVAVGGAIAALATPIGWVALAVAGLTAALTWAWHESEVFRAVVTSAWTRAQRVIERGVGIVTGVIAHLRDETTLLGGIWQTVWDGVKRHFDIVWTGIQQMWEAGKRVFQGVWDVIGGILDGDWARAWNGAKDVALGSWDLLWTGMGIIRDQIWNGLKLFFVELPNSIYGWLMENGPAIWAGLQEWWATFKRWFVETVPLIIEQLVSWGTAIGDWLATEAPQKIISGAEQLWQNHLLPWFMDLPIKIMRAVNNAQKFQQWFAEYGPTILKGLAIAVGVVVLGIPALILLIGGAIIAGLAIIAVSISRSLTTHLTSAAVKAFAGMQQTAIQRAAAFLAWLRGLPARAGAALGGMAGRMMSVGRDIITGIINGLSRGAGRLYGSLRNLATTALNAAKNALGISSPSRVFRDEVGDEIVNGLLAGIGAGQGQVDRAMQSLVSARPTISGRGVRVPVSAEVSRHAEAQRAQRVTAHQDLVRSEELTADLLGQLLAAVRAQGDGDVVVQVDSREVARANRKGEHDLARR
jgi:tape measure domain-containing protein